MKYELSVFYMLLFLGSVIPLPSLAQSNNPFLTLEDIFKNNIYQDTGYGPIRWSKDSKGYFTFNRIMNLPEGILFSMMRNKVTEQ